MTWKTIHQIKGPHYLNRTAGPFSEYTPQVNGLLKQYLKSDA
jgi:hypothetical protein